MDSEDDISILPYPDDDIDVDGGFNPIVPFSPFTPFTASSAAAAAVDPGSHYALEKAYLTLKQKLTETKAQNLQLAQKVQELESSSGSKTATTTPSGQLNDTFVAKTNTVPEYQQLAPRFEEVESSSTSKTSTATSPRELPESFVVKANTLIDQRSAPQIEEVESSSSSKTATASTSKTSTTTTSPRQLPESFVVKANPLIDQRSAPQIEELGTLSLKTRELDSFVTIGESFDMMEDARYGESGVEGSRQMTQREMEGRLCQYKEALTQKNQILNSLTQQVAQLQEEKRRLQKGWEGERGEKERALQSLQALRETCSSLEQERDKALKEGASFHASLKKVSVEMAALKEKQGESSVVGSADPPPELVDELTRMRKVIDKLKAVVLMQKDCLVNQSMSMSRNSLNHAPRDSSAVSSMEPPPHSSSPSPSHPLGTTNGAGSGSHSAQSWEMVNGVTPLSTIADLRQQQLQQRSAKMIPVELGQRRDGSIKSSASGPPSGNAGKPVAGGNQNGAVVLNIPNGQTPTYLNNQKPRQDAMHRRNSENLIQQPPDSRVVEGAAPRAHTLPQQTPHRGLAQWMGTHYQHQQQQQQQVGLNQIMKDAPNQQRMASPSRPLQPAGIPYSSSSSNNVFHENQRQHPSSVGQPNSTYDNITMASSSPSSNQANTGPSMHFLNQSSMTGARVLQNNFGSGGGGMDSNPQIQVSVNRDGGGSGFRGSPQEQSEALPRMQSPSRPRNPTDLELNTPTEIHFANELPGVNLDRKCPVCGGDFSRFTMDEFQTHVFECFDDSEDLPNALETLQAPGQEGGGGGGGGGRVEGTASNGRTCPMCQELFADTVSQVFFERHVQSHFEAVIDQFEMLDVHRS